ncbi:hypothetical protein BW12_08875 [Bifidobacterium sp. UTCIF-3]|nr:hypothetical protein BW09_07300 [Bifidobacterium sp. UTCIF-1]TPF79561.1 hypothetical protein BW08_09425 [Bifidobacterium sp. UTCIF-24]TPF81640.1 hypothetical protein BW12_08875 [Bifidobacterium sp. UTCIF-3]TPF88078.1 hypothetical protein BW10_10535 [Bifidobacterium sp. UTBIF-56]
MITPADLAQMLGQTPSDAGNHTQDQLLYSSQTPQNSADLDGIEADRQRAERADSDADASDDDGRAPISPAMIAAIIHRAATANADQSNTGDGQDDQTVDSSGSHTARASHMATDVRQPQSAAAAPRPVPPPKPQPKPHPLPVDRKPESRSAMPTPAMVFGMRATVTIATANGTIVGQTEGIAAEAETVADDAAAALSAVGDTTVAGDTVEAAATPTAASDATDAADRTTAPRGPKTPASAPLSAAAAMRAIAAATLGKVGSNRTNHTATVAPAAPAPAAAPATELAASTVAVASSGPTPAIMPQRRTSEGPTTFASLDAQELPVVREYSAGGLIFDDQNRVAIIARHSRSGHLEWCLPKGHIEKGETPQQTAVREVHEETGILGEVIDSIATIDYWFTGTTQRVHKLVHHFALRQTGGELTVEGDPDHEAEDAIWVRFDDLDDVLSYPNERKIAWLYAKKKNRQANE